MKLQYKRLVIIISAGILIIAFIILTLLPQSGTGNSAEDAKLSLNENPEINKLITDYFTAKKAVDLDAFNEIVSDPNQIDKKKFTAMAAYVEDYQNIDCYVIEDEGGSGYRVYVKYDMKLKNIDTPAPSLSAFYVTSTSEGKYIIYLSALDEVQQDFIQAADKNESIVALVDDVQKSLDTAIDQDASFKQLYQRMDQEIKTASGAAASVSGTTATINQ